MKGVILAGGLGTRLLPFTHNTNKHLLPVWDKPMIHYPIESLLKSGIKDIMIVSNDQDAFREACADEYSCKFQFAHQEGEGGIAAALSVARDYVGDDNCCVMLGDNIYQFNASVAVRSFKEWQEFGSCTQGALIVTKAAATAEDCTRFGCAVSQHQDIEELIEKPSFDKVVELTSEGHDVRIITGTYCYTPDVFDICANLTPSGRGELEITDVNSEYLRRGCLEEFHTDGWWQDAGTFESLYQATTRVRKDGANHDDD
jgi:glucose-1-phosphate thymidylyltransferase